MPTRARLATTVKRAVHRLIGRHINYLSTGCLHGDQLLPDGRTGHEYCQGKAGRAGAKRPGECKHCRRRCICACHDHAGTTPHKEQFAVAEGYELTDEQRAQLNRPELEGNPMSTRLISSAPLWHLHQAQGRVHELQDWARANGLDPDDVSAGHDITVEDTPDGRVIRCQVFVRADDGKPWAVDLARFDEPLMEERVVPLVEEPPAHWPIYAVPGSPRQDPGPA